MQSYTDQRRQDGEIIRGCVEALYAHLQFAKPDLMEPGIADEDRFFEFRIRLHDGDWYLHIGDPSYDQDHRGSIGAGSVSVEDVETDIRAEVVRVLEQARDVEHTDAESLSDWTVDRDSLDRFERSYIESMLWSSTDGEDGSPLDADYGESDLSDDALRRIRLDCSSFQAALDANEWEPEYGNPQFDDDELCAHDFWLTRNGHGAGFWDGDLPEPLASQLTTLAKGYGEQTVYVGDNGEVEIL